MVVPSAGCEGRWDQGVPASSERYLMLQRSDLRPSGPSATLFEQFPAYFGSPVTFYNSTRDVPIR
jgi:hypothetical protein